MWTSVGQVILQLHAEGKSFHASMSPDDFHHTLLQAERERRGKKDGEAAKGQTKLIAE